MRIGLIGSGNMARALARGWGEPVLCTDALHDRAEALAAETGGEPVASNAELAERAEIVVLCHKPAQLEDVAREVAGPARCVASILGGVPLARLREAYGETPVFRLIPSTPVEVRRGVVCFGEAPGADPDVERAVIDLFGRLGPLVKLPESLIDVATGVMSCAPAYVALVAEALIDAGVRHGLTAEQAAPMVVGTLAGTAALLEAHEYDTLGVRRAVTSPGGITARGLEALERAGLRTAFMDAMEATTRR